MTSPHCTNGSRTSDELYFYQAGAPLHLLLLDGDRAKIAPSVPSDPGQRPRCWWELGVWQGSTSAGDWTLVSTVVAPGFDWSDFELAEAAELLARFPDAAARITALTR